MSDHEAEVQGGYDVNGPMKPRKVRNPYMIFCSHMRPSIDAELRQREPNLAPKDRMPKVAKLCGWKWNNMSDEQKAPFQQEYEADRARLKSVTKQLDKQGLLQKKPVVKAPSVDIEAMDEEQLDDFMPYRQRGSTLKRGTSLKHGQAVSQTISAVESDIVDKVLGMHIKTPVSSVARGRSSKKQAVKASTAKNLSKSQKQAVLFKSARSLGSVTVPVEQGMSEKMKADLAFRFGNELAQFTDKKHNGSVIKMSSNALLESFHKALSGATSAPQHRGRDVAMAHNDDEVDLVDSGADDDDDDDDYRP